MADRIPGPNLRRLLVVFQWKENRFGWPLRGVIWFTVAIIGCCTVVALLGGYSAAIINRSIARIQTDKWAKAMAAFEQQDREMPRSPRGYRIRRELKASR